MIKMDSETKSYIKTAVILALIGFGLYAIVWAVLSYGLVTCTGNRRHYEAIKNCCYFRSVQGSHSCLDLPDRGYAILLQTLANPPAESGRGRSSLVVMSEATKGGLPAAPGGMEARGLH